MKILLLSPTDLKGGASRVAYDLARTLHARRHEVLLAVDRKFSAEPFVVEVPIGTVRPLVGRISRRLGITHFSVDQHFSPAYREVLGRDWDVIHMHDQPRFVTARTLVPSTRSAPFLWSLHSMLPLTGGCIYAYDCTRWQGLCGKCPQHGVWPLHWTRRDGSRLVMLGKRLVYRQARLHVIGVSRWITECARQSVLGRHPRSTIHNGIDLDVFRPQDRMDLRQQLGIPDNAFAIMFSVAGNPADTRKGLPVILRALEQMKSERIFLIPTGITQLDPEASRLFEELNGLPFKHVTSPEELARLYAAADVFWSPTRADNLPLSLIEALACGTPVIASNVGGVPEIVVDGQNGLLMQDPGSDRELVSLTRKLREWPDPEELRERCRSDAMRFSISNFVDAHESLYASILAGN